MKHKAQKLKLSEVLVISFFMETMNVHVPYDEHDSSRVGDKSSSSVISVESLEGENMMEPDHLCEAKEWGESKRFDSLYDDRFYEKKPDEQELLSEYQRQEQQNQLLSGYGLLDSMRFDIASPPIQTCLEEIAKFQKISNEVLDNLKTRKAAEALASLEILKNYGSGWKRLNEERIIRPCIPVCEKVEENRLSTTDIVRIAATKMIQSLSKTGDTLSILGHPYDIYFGLSEDDKKKVQLAEVLLAAAEKLDNGQYGSASSLLDWCDEMCSYAGNAVERFVYYFSEALREKIDRETGEISEKGLMRRKIMDADAGVVVQTSQCLPFHEKVPFSQILQFSAIQTIVDNVSKAKKVHVVDFGIRNGIQWTVLMQALAARCQCPIEHLKITAIGTSSEQAIEDTGKRLKAFAKTLNIPLTFKMIMLSDMLDLKADLFELNDEESVVVHSQFFLKSLLPQPDRLESVMKLIRNIKPCIVVIGEVDSNLNSPVFVQRVVEALFFYSAYFDCLENCVKENNEYRTLAESFFAQAMRTVLAAEGGERNIRHVKINVWRTFFQRYGLAEVELGMASLYQAELVVSRFPCGSYCTLDMNEKTLIMGWKGVPMHSLSAWKFQW